MTHSDWLYYLGLVCIIGGVWLIVLYKLHSFSARRAGLRPQPRPSEWDEWVRTHPSLPEPTERKRDASGRFTS